jgi:hypothetical protein
MSKVDNPITPDSRLAELNELFGEPSVLLEFRKHPGLPGDECAASSNVSVLGISQFSAIPGS